jgi:TRAP-type transport system periplasmic protein
VPPDVQQILNKQFNDAARKQREDNARLNADLQESPEAKGLIFNTVDAALFQGALRSGGFYTQWRGKFGTEI